MSLQTIAYLKSRFQSGDFPTEQDFIDLIDTLGSGTSYKKYVALLTQTGTNAPIATVLENTLGFTPTYTYVGSGQYTIVSSAGFTINKTTQDISNKGSHALSTEAIGIYYFSSSAIQININGGDNTLDKTSVEIRVYP